MSLDRLDLEVVVIVFANIPKTIAAYSTQSLLQFIFWVFVFSKMLPPVKSPDEVADDDHEDGKTENRCIPQFQDSAAIT